MIPQVGRTPRFGGQAKGANQEIQQFTRLTQSRQEHKERPLQLRDFAPLCEANSWTTEIGEVNRDARADNLDGRGAGVPWRGACNRRRTCNKPDRRSVQRTRKAGKPRRSAKTLQRRTRKLECKLSKHRRNARMHQRKPGKLERKSNKHRCNARKHKRRTGKLKCKAGKHGRRQGKHAGKTHKPAR